MRRLGDREVRLDLGDLDIFFFLGVMERELERERLFFRGLGESDGLLLGDFECDLEGAAFNALGDWEGLLFGDFERDRDDCVIF